jgi:proline iminopeptidase
VAAIPVVERRDLLQAYRERLFHNDPAVYLPAARAWGRYEGSTLYLEPDPVSIEAFSNDALSVGIGRLEAHYFLNGGFLAPGQLLRDIAQIIHLPAVIIQGRYDVICPPLAAYRLHEAWPEAQFRMIGDAGHAAFEPGIAAALIAATEQFRLTGHFDRLP